MLWVRIKSSPYNLVANKISGCCFWRVLGLGPYYLYLNGLNPETHTRGCRGMKTGHRDRQMFRKAGVQWGVELYLPVATQSPSMFIMYSKWGGWLV